MPDPRSAAGPRGARAEAVVDLAAVRHNVGVLAAAAPGAALMAVVKADGYGHGAIPVARAALDAGATWLGVCTLDEALELRGGGIGAPVLSWLHLPDEYFAPAVAAGIDLSVASRAHLAAVADGARRAAQQHALSDLARKATRITVVAVLVSSVGSVVLMIALSLLSAHSSLVVGSWWMFAGMLIWFGINAATAPSTLMATGVGRPQEELRYLVPCLVATGICWSVGILVGSTAVMIYGAGIASSFGEAKYVVDDPSANFLGFDVHRVLRTGYYIDDFQATYFVIDRFEDLFDLLKQTDFVALYDRLQVQPGYTPFEIRPEDVIIRQGTGDYWRSFPATKSQLK